MRNPVAQGLRYPAAMRATDDTTKRRQRAGFSLIEVVVALAIIGVLAALGMPRFQQFMANQRVKSAARSMADALLLARAEAIRTGNAHIVYLSSTTTTDPGGNPLGDDPRGGTWPAVVLNDGEPGTWDCEIAAGEPRRNIASEPGVSWGFTLAGGMPAPGDYFDADPAPGTTFRDAAGNTVPWVLFRGDGIPLAFDAACTIGTIGSGGGAVYVTNGNRDYAVVLSPLGAVRVHAFEPGANAWTE